MCRRARTRGRSSAAAATGGSSRLEELHVIGDDLGHTSFLPILAFPRTCLYAALDENERALACVLSDRLGQVPLPDRVRDDVVVVGELLPLAVRPGRPAVGGDAAVPDRGPARRG